MSGKKRKISPCLVKIVKFQFITARVLTITERVPLGDLPSIVTDLLPVLHRFLLLLLPGPTAQSPHFGIPFQNPKPEIQHLSLQTSQGMSKTKSSLNTALGVHFFTCVFFFRDSLFGMVQVHFDIGIQR